MIKLADEAEMEQHWRPPEHVPADQHTLWVIERILPRLWKRLGSYDSRPLSDPIERRDLEDACTILWNIMEPIKREIHDDFDDFLMRHRHVKHPPEFGSYPKRPNLTEAEAEKWWESKTPLERYRTFGQPELPPELMNESNLQVMLVGFGAIGKDAAAVSPYAEWKDIPQNDRAILLTWMQKGWVDFGNTTIGYAQ